MMVVTLTQADNRKSIQVQRGDVIAVQLPETPATGYRWHIDHLTGDVELIDDSFELGPSPRIGSGGIRVFRFRGTGWIKLKHWQKWEGDASVTERWTVELLSPP
jgi:inhibitor of cysteine peptidase